MTIKPGDLVMVTGCGCECTSGEMGTIATVIRVKKARSFCHLCGKKQPSSAHALIDWGDDTEAYKPISWLKRIDPLREPEIIEERLAVKA